jgi:hypothetical protein
MSREVHVQFCERAGVRLPCATHLIVQCRSEAQTKAALELIQQWAEQNGLVVHPTKTRIVDATRKGGFDFLGYHFERGMKWPRQKSLEKFKQAIRHHMHRKEGHSPGQVIAGLTPLLRGWFAYFQHSQPSTFSELDGWIVDDRGASCASIKERRAELEGSTISDGLMPTSTSSGFTVW